MKRKKFKPLEIGKYPLLEVDWVDSHSCSGWTDIDKAKEFTEDDGCCKSVGYLIGETEYMITLVMNLSLDFKSKAVKEVDGAMSIPKVAIRSRNEIILD